MTFSPLTNRTVTTAKHGARTGPISRLVVHYTAGGTTSSNVRELSTGPRQVSSTYVLGRDGELVGIVPEERRPWTSGSRSADGPSVTVEVVATQAAGVTDAQMTRLAQLAADLCRRYGWGRLDRNRIMGHREFQATDCPGPLWPRLAEIVAAGNRILDGATQPTKPKGETADMPLNQSDLNAIAGIADRNVWGASFGSRQAGPMFRELCDDTERVRVQLGATQAELAKLRAETRQALAEIKEMLAGGAQ